MYQRSIQERLPAILETMSRAAEISGRSLDDVRLVAVTKGHPPEAVSAALGSGLMDIGENRVEELERKVSLFLEQRPRWHMIGHLQRRKAKKAAELADMIHSVDSIPLAERLARMGTEMGKDVSVLIQVNTSGEASKSGFSSDETADVVGRLLELGGITPRGLMTMAPLTDDEALIRQTFQALRRVGEGLADLPEIGALELSMGMSNDFGIAIEEGSTMIRLGTALLGARSA